MKTTLQQLIVLHSGNTANTHCRHTCLTVQSACQLYSESCAADACFMLLPLLLFPLLQLCNICLCSPSPMRRLSAAGGYASPLYLLDVLLLAVLLAVLP